LGDVDVDDRLLDVRQKADTKMRLQFEWSVYSAVKKQPNVAAFLLFKFRFIGIQTYK
jgi:hypothetical protein